MLLVVGILTLLAVIGMVYIVTARTEKASARASTEAVNLDFARDAALAHLTNVLYESTTGDAGAFFARPDPWRPNRVYNAGDVVMGRDHRAYRCITAHTSSSTVADNGPPLTRGSSKWAVYDFATAQNRARSFDYPDDGGNAVNGQQYRSTNDTSVPGQAWLVHDIAYTGARARDFTRLSPFRFNRSNGLADIAMPTTPEVAVVNPSGPADGVWHLLPYSSAAGLRYRVAWRVVDSARFANVNSGSVDATATDPFGTYITALGLYTSPNNATDQWSLFDVADNPVVAQLHEGKPGINGRRGSVTDPFTTLSWQTRIFNIERFGLANTGSGQKQVQFFDLADELELRAYNTLGTGATPRPATLWPNTLGRGKATRALFTTYSPTRNVSSVQVGNPKFTFTYGGTAYSWPTDATGNPANWRTVHLTATSLSAAERVRNAAYLANAMHLAGYTDDQALSAAVNYIAQCDNTYRGSAITPQGLVLAPNPTTPATITPAPTKTYLGYRAQPFINEIAMVVQDADPAPRPVKEFAVELIQPYNTTVNLKDWRLSVWDPAASSNPPVVWVSDLSAGGDSGTLTSGDMTRGYAVYASAGGTNTLPSAGAKATGGNVDDIRGKWVVLEAPYRDSNGNLQHMIVDYLIVPGTADWPGNPGPTPTPATYSIQKNNLPDPNWFAVISPSNIDRTAAPSLGAINTVTPSDSTIPGLELPDAWASGEAWGGLAVRNVGDLFRISLITNHTDPDNLARPFYTVSQRMIDQQFYLMTNNATGSLFPQEAKFRFDFGADPRAQRFLELVSLVDRASDGLDQTGRGVDSADELAIQGRININTADGRVIRAIPVFRAMTAALADKTVANILAYRDRTRNIPFNGQTSDDFSDTTLFPGKGFRNISELVIPVAFAQTQLSAVTGTPPRLATTAASLRNLHDMWMRLHSYCTVRSDAFVVYGYLEAVRDRPGGPTPYAATGDDIVARRRFVAIVDRSLSNGPRSSPDYKLPRILAIKDLPY